MSMAHVDIQSATSHNAALEAKTSHPDLGSE